MTTRVMIRVAVVANGIWTVRLAQDRSTGAGYSKVSNAEYFVFVMIILNVVAVVVTVQLTTSVIVLFMSFASLPPCYAFRRQNGVSYQLNSVIPPIN